jgi:hypothetical protein
MGLGKFTSGEFMQIPESDHTIQALVDAHHADKTEIPRPHLGASALGHACDRWLWLSFRWAVQPKFPGRILRLFRRGHQEEVNIISDLRAVGIDVRKVSAQHRVDFGSHVSGSLDAIIDKGVPEAPKAKHVAEFKTHNKKSFDALVKDGVEKSKPDHFVQMQLYMSGTGIDRALYVAVCKDDDRMHTERVKFDKEVADKAIRRGHYIALSEVCHRQSVVTQAGISVSFAMRMTFVMKAKRPSTSTVALAPMPHQCQTALGTALSGMT